MRKTLFPFLIISATLLASPSTYSETDTVILLKNHAAPTLTLEDAWQRVKASNPDIKAAAFTVDATKGQQEQSKLIPNPTISYTLEQAQGTGQYSNMQMAQSTLVVSEPIELGGKLSARKAVANSQYDMTKSADTATTATMFNITAYAFLSVAEAQAQWQLNQQAVAVNQQIVATIQQRMQAGRSSELEVKTAQIALADQQLALKTAQRALESARFNLANLWGGDAAQVSSVLVPTLDSMTLAPLAVYTQKLGHNPELQRFLQAEKTEQAQIKLAEAKAVPDVSLGVGMQHFNQTHDNAYVAQVSMPIPLFDRNQGNTQSALANYDKALEDTQAKKNSLSSELLAAYQNAAQALLQIQTFKQTILPNAERALELAKQGYEQGRFSYVELLNAQQKLTEEKQRYLAAEFTYCKNWIALQVMTGMLPRNNA